MPQPIQLYTWPTPNGHKVHIMLEELGLPYDVHPIDIGRGDQFAPEFLKISPNNKMPAIVDPDGPDGAPLSLFESGAILLYLADKHHRFIPQDERARQLTLQWLMWQMGGLGPMLGQAHHFLRYAPVEIPYGRERYSKEAQRLYGILDKRLSEARYLAGEDYTIADMAVWPWTRSPEAQGVNRDSFPNFKRWFDEIAERPAVQRGVQVLAEQRRPEMSAEEKEFLFGSKQYERR
ncbi:MAG TPA: glutathione S-transferase N-terminal domain-containing protein [Kiloniellales bacterium]|jgi:GST-like protein|nr:glutathione S-transferase N-terminal domain-containing protein [Kiloniellales bacterium]